MPLSGGKKPTQLNLATCKAQSDVLKFWAYCKNFGLGEPCLEGFFKKKGLGLGYTIFLFVCSCSSIPILNFICEKI